MADDPRLARQRLRATATTVAEQREAEEQPDRDQREGLEARVDADLDEEVAAPPEEAEEDEEEPVESGGGVGEGRGHLDVSCERRTIGAIGETRPSAAP